MVCQPDLIVGGSLELHLTMNFLLQRSVIRSSYCQMYTKETIYVDPLYIPFIAHHQVMDMRLFFMRVALLHCILSHSTEHKGYPYGIDTVENINYTHKNLTYRKTKIFVIGENVSWIVIRVSM